MNPTQRNNLARLAVYCHRLPKGYEHFDMRAFCSIGGDPCKTPGYILQCGTTACFAGHGPSAGIPPLPEETWGRYIARAFGCNAEDFVWSWLFGIFWPNDITAACKRAAWIMDEHDIPNGFSVDFEALVASEEYKAFEPDWKRIEKMAEEVVS